MPETFEIDVKREGDVGVIGTQGYINGKDAEPVVDASKKLMGEGVVALVLNLAGSPVANSIGISILIDVIEGARESDIRVAFCCVDGTLAKTLRIMGLLQVAELYETEDEAVQGKG